MAAGTTDTHRRHDRVQHARLAAAPIAMALVDLALTLSGQTSTYWAGDYGAVLESNPAARVLLAMHPIAMVVAYVPYLAAIAIFILRLRPDAARSLALVLTLGHAFGASTWLLRLPGGVACCVAIWVVARLLYGLGDEAV
jgi:hypothetical protein